MNMTSKTSSSCKRMKCVWCVLTILKIAKIILEYSINKMIKWIRLIWLKNCKSLMYKHRCLKLIMWMIYIFKILKLYKLKTNKILLSPNVPILSLTLMTYLEFLLPLEGSKNNSKLILKKELKLLMMILLG